MRTFLSVVIIALAAKSVLASSAGIGARSVVDHTCGRDHAGDFDYSWCIDKPRNSQNQDVLYSYHGLRGTAEAWATAPHGQAISQAIAARVDLPTVISISFGDAWLITDLPTAAGHESMESVIVHKIMPALEARAGAIHPRRIVLGISMGGFNAGQLAFKESAFFADAILICPIAQAVGPYSSDEDVNQAIARQGPDVEPDNYRGAINWMRTTFPDQASWNRHNLLSLALGLNKNSIPIFLTTGRQDQYGFFEGAQMIAATAQRLNAPFEWEPLNGRHCVYDAEAIAKHLYGH